MAKGKAASDALRDLGMDRLVALRRLVVSGELGEPIDVRIEVLSDGTLHVRVCKPGALKVEDENQALIDRIGLAARLS